MMFGPEWSSSFGVGGVVRKQRKGRGLGRIIVQKDQKEKLIPALNKIIIIIII